MELERIAPGSCYDRSTGKRRPRQTLRDGIKVDDIIKSKSVVKVDVEGAEVSVLDILSLLF